MHIEDVVSAVLADDNRRLRRQFPDLFAAVDELKRQPGRTPAHELTYAEAECLWCGDDFPAANNATCCTREHRVAYDRWRKARRTKEP